MIHTEILGRLGKDVEMRETQSGMKIANFSLGSTTKYKEVENTSWLRCVAWGKTGEIIAEYCKKGDQILCVGTLEQKRYEKDGEQKEYWELTVDKFEFGAKSKANEEAPQDYTRGAAKTQSNMAPDLDSIEMPF